MLKNPTRPVYAQNNLPAVAQPIPMRAVRPLQAPQSLHTTPSSDAESFGRDYPTQLFSPPPAYNPSTRAHVLRAPQQTGAFSAPFESPGFDYARAYPQAEHRPTVSSIAALRASALTNPNKLGAYNDALESVRADINGTMSVAQRSLGRTLTIAASITALGGGVAAGLLGIGALGAAASAVGLPVAAVAAIAAAAVFVGGTALAVTVGALARSLVRRSLHKNPEIHTKLEAVRQLRDQLKANPNRNEGEQMLLRNANRVLAKVDGFGSHFKSQLKLSAKTDGITVAAAVASVFLAMASPLLLGGSGGGSGSMDVNARGSRLKGDPFENVSIDNGQALLDAMKRA